MKKKGRKYFFLALTLLAIIFLPPLLPDTSVSLAGEDPFTEPEALVIELSVNPEGGKWAFLEGTVGPAGENLLLKDLWITRPVQIAVRAENKDDNILVELRQYHWAEPGQTCATGTRGICTMQFKTQGDVWIHLSSGQEGGKVSMAVWESEEILPELKPWFVPKSGGQQ